MAAPTTAPSTPSLQDLLTLRYLLTTSSEVNAVARWTQSVELLNDLSPSLCLAGCAIQSDFWAAAKKA